MTEEKRREKLVIRSGILGICCNLLLAAAKYLVGSLSGALSLMADAANNLSDAGSGIVTIAGTLLSGKPVDREHPFGHGRLEYIAALVVSFLILHMGFDLGRDGIERILHPEALTLRPIYILAPVGSIAVKLFLALVYHLMYRKTGSLSLKAVRLDSLTDCIATAAALAAMLICGKTDAIRLDGIIGLGVSLLVIWSGIRIAKDILGPLLGQPPSAGLVQEIEQRLLQEEQILSVHDLIVHDYGPAHRLASAHAVMPAEEDVMLLHEVIDRAEKRIERELNIAMCIHIDPIRRDDAARARYRALTERVLRENFPEGYSFHDFRCEVSDGKSALEFELVVPFSARENLQEIAARLESLLREADSTVTAQITVEHSYV